MTRRLLIVPGLVGGLAMLLGLALAFGGGAISSGGRETLSQSVQGVPAHSAAGSADRQPARSGGRESEGAVPKEAKLALIDLPLRFITNAGQTDPNVRFTVRGAGHTIFTPEQVIFGAIAEAEGEERPLQSLVRLRFAGANPVSVVEGLEPLPGAVNYFLGNDRDQWHVGAPAYEAVAYRDLYPGIDLIYRGTQGHLKSEFWLAPGADPTIIEMVYEGIEGPYLRDDGALVLQTPLGELTGESPLIYQEGDGVRHIIPGGYVRRGDDRAGF